MKITQLIATKTPYHESVASRLPRGIKTQKQLFNLGYRIAVEDLGLAKAKTLNENFAAKLLNSYHAQSLNEGIGSFLGKAAGHVVGGAGAAWRDAKKGYADAKASYDPKPDAADAAAPAVEPTAPPAGGSAPAASDRPYVAPAGGGGVGDIMKAIDGLDPESKKQLAGELDKSINTPAPAAPAPAAPAPAAPAAPQGQALDLDQLKKDREAKQAAGQAGQQQAQQQMAATQQANAAQSQQDAAIKAAADAAKAKPPFQQTAADKLAIKAAADNGIREEYEVAEGVIHKFKGLYQSLISKVSQIPNFKQYYNAAKTKQKEAVNAIRTSKNKEELKQKIAQIAGSIQVTEAKPMSKLDIDDQEHQAGLSIAAPALGAAGATAAGLWDIWAAQVLGVYSTAASYFAAGETGMGLAGGVLFGVLGQLGCLGIAIYLATTAAKRYSAKKAVDNSTQQGANENFINQSRQAVTSE